MSDEDNNLKDSASTTKEGYLADTVRFSDYISRIQVEVAADKREADAKFERKLMIGRFVRMGLWGAAAYFVIRAVKNVNQHSKEDEAS